MQVEYRTIFIAKVCDADGGVDISEQRIHRLDTEWWNGWVKARGMETSICFTINDGHLEVVGGGPDGVSFGLTAESAVSNLAQWYEDCANRMSSVARNNYVIAEMLRFASKKLGGSTR